MSNSASFSRSRSTSPTLFGSFLIPLRTRGAARFYGGFTGGVAIYVLCADLEPLPYTAGAETRGRSLTAPENDPFTPLIAPYSANFVSNSCNAEI